MFNLRRNQVIITVLVFMIAIAAYLNTQDPNMSGQLNLVDNGQMLNEVAEATPGNNQYDFSNLYDDVISNNVESAEVENIEGGDIAIQDEVQDEYFEEYVQEDAALEVGEQVSEEVINSEDMAVLSEEEAQGMNNGFQAVITKKEAVNSEVGNVAASTQVDETDYFAEEKLLREQSRAAQVEQLSQYVANENLDSETKAKAAENLLEIQERIEKENSAEALLRAKGFKEVYVRIDDKGVDVVVSKSELTDTDIAQIEEIVNRKTGYSVGKIKITPLNTTIKSNQVEN